MKTTANQQRPTTASFALAGLTLAVGAALGFPAPAAAQPDELNALAWCDHLDADLIEPFEEKHDVTVNLQEYEGTGTALSIIEQSRPGDWDVLVVDSTDVRRVVDAGILAEIDPDDFPTEDIRDGLGLERLHKIDGAWYAMPEKFGYNTVAFDRTKVDVEDMRDIDMMWDEKYADRIAVYDYYLPVIAQVAVALGMSPAELTAEDLPAIQDKLLALKDNAAMVADVVSSQTALSTGEVDIVVGGGEFAVSVLAQERPELDWVLPDQGGIRWMQAIGVFADSERKDLATKFVQHVLSAEGQAAIATSDCYWGMPTNTEADLSDEQKEILRWDEQPEFIANSFAYPELDRKMQDVWAEFLAH